MTDRQDDPTSPRPDRDPAVDDARRFHLSEDWLATIVGLTLVVLTAAGVVTEGWLPL